MLNLLNAACSHIYKNATAFTTSARSKVSDYAGMLDRCQLEIIVTAKRIVVCMFGTNNEFYMSRRKLKVGTFAPKNIVRENSKCMSQIFLLVTIILCPRHYYICWYKERRWHITKGWGGECCHDMSLQHSPPPLCNIFVCGDFLQWIPRWNWDRNGFETNIWRR